MDLLKALKRTTILSAAAMLAFGAAEAQAVDDVAVVGHVSASVTGLLSVVETQAINFGNFSITCGGTCATGGALTMTDKGNRSWAAGGSGATVVLLTGNSHAGTVGTGSNLSTGAQTPGFYTISDGGDAGANAYNVYVSFADNTGAIIDANHPNNNVVLTGPTSQTFYVDTFTFESDNGAAVEGSSGYSQLNPSTGDAYGNSVPLVAGSAVIRVGATLHTNATVLDYAPGQYKNTYIVMVSY